MFSGVKSRDGVPKMVEDYMAGKLKVDEFISGVKSLEQINEAFELMHHPVGTRWEFTIFWTATL